jgi:protein SCO1/2
LIRKCLVLLLVLGAGACSQPEPETKSYTLTGQILAVHPDRQSLTIKHEDIPGYMPGMTMTFVARDASLIAGRAPGELVKATLEVSETSGRLTALEVTGTGPITAMPAELALAEGILAEGDTLPPAMFLDAQGRARQLAEWRGAPLVITFTYTRCPLPDFCPRIDRKFAELQRAIAGDPALAGRARLLTISFDPGFDTPAVLDAHARTLGANPDVWTFATGSRDEIELFAARFGVAVTRTGETPADVMHNLRTVVASADGTIRALHSGADWEVAQLVEDLRAAR